jgi:metal-responsive CopG/Arc/MetJ family transcriptional regulator
MYNMADKVRLTITIDKELLNWIDEKISQKAFANRSHALEFLMRNKRGQS